MGTTEHYEERDPDDDQTNGSTGDGSSHGQSVDRGPGTHWDLSQEDSLTLLWALRHVLGGDESLANQLGSQVQVVQDLLEGRIPITEYLREWIEDYLNVLHTEGRISTLEPYRPGQPAGMPGPSCREVDPLADTGGGRGQGAGETAEHSTPGDTGARPSDTESRHLPVPLRARLPKYEPPLAGAPMYGENAARDLMRRQMWNAYLMTLFAQSRLPLSPSDQYTARILTIHIELLLIMVYQDSPPQSGATWDRPRRIREIEWRLDRLHSLERKTQALHRGFHGDVGHGILQVIS